MSSLETISASSAKTTSSNSGVFRCPDDSGRLTVHANVTAASGTSPTLALAIEWSADGLNFAAAEGVADTFASITAAKVTLLSTVVKAPFYRVKWTVGGTTPSFTFGLIANYREV